MEKGQFLPSLVRDIKEIINNLNIIIAKIPRKQHCALFFLSFFFLNCACQTQYMCLEYSTPGRGNYESSLVIEIWCGDVIWSGSLMKDILGEEPRLTS